MLTSIYKVQISFFVLKKKQEVLIVAYDDDDSHADSASVAIPQHALGHILGLFDYLFAAAHMLACGHTPCFSVRYFIVLHDLSLACIFSST